MKVLVVGPEVVGFFRSERDALEWGETYIGDKARYRVADFTQALTYELEASRDRARRRVRGRRST